MAGTRQNTWLAWTGVVADINGTGKTWADWSM